MKTSVLLTEDDNALAFVIQDNLTEAGYRVTTCGNGQLALQEFQKNKFDICILDVNLPEMDGFTLAKKIRQENEVVPILFLTAKDREEDKIKGFAMGGDDYITKPFSMQELKLRMEVFLRRTKNFRGGAQDEFTIGKFRFNYKELKLYNQNEIINLTQKEASLLKFLIQNSNKILKREEVLLNVWGKDDYFLGRSMDVFITKLRKHFRANPEINIETIHGIGFRLNI